MSIHFPRRRWAESGDWDSVRPLITRMYKVEGRSLKEVMRIMEIEHQFLATPKMYKKRIKDWAIDKNLKSERRSASPRTRQPRDVPEESQPGARSAQRPSSAAAADSSPCLFQDFQYDNRPSAGGATQREYHSPGTTWPSQQGQHWAGPSQSHVGGGSYKPPSPPRIQLSEQARPSSPSTLISSIRDRFLEASDAITRRDTAVLFEILNPAYEAISQVPEAEMAQLLAVVVDLVQVLSRRPNHEDMLRQLLHYIFALVPDAGRRNRFLATDGLVLALLGRSGYDDGGSSAARVPVPVPMPMPLDTAGGVAPGLAVPAYNSHGYYGQPSGPGRASGNRS